MKKVSEMKQNGGSDMAAQAKEVDAVIVGAGFSGIFLLDRLRDLGFSVQLVEAGADLGGVWWWNSYPGARVDAFATMYQFSYKDLWRDFSFSELYPNRDEMLRYFDYVDSKLELRKDIRFNTRVVAAEFSETDDRWIVRMSDGTVVRARFLLPCVGFASKPYIPPILGLEDFSGASHHTAFWPQDGVSFVGKRVGIIGTGASAIQVAQASAEEAAQTTIFQRTPNMALPMRQRSLSAEEYAELKDTLPAAYMKRPLLAYGTDEEGLDHPLTSVSPEERDAKLEELWSNGGLGLWILNYNDILSDENSNRIVYDFWRSKVIARIEDPVIAEKLAPAHPPHPFGVKRVSLEQNYYDIFNQANVDLVDITANPIARITRSGVVTTDGVEHELDVLVWATGFDSHTGGLTQIDIMGTAGRTLGEKWREGVDSHFGVMTNEFPNLIYSYGPQSPSALSNGPASAELQGEEIAQLLVHLRDRGITRAESTPENDQAWTARIALFVDSTLLDRADSWYMGANIPGKRRQLLNFPFGVRSYLDDWADLRQREYQDFLTVSSDPGAMR